METQVPKTVSRMDVSIKGSWCPFSSFFVLSSNKNMMTDDLDTILGYESNRRDGREAGKGRDP